MTSQATIYRAGLLAILLSILWASPVSGDRLHLEGGGHIETDSWWMEGDWLYCESAGGTIGMPRASVVRIEKTAPTGSASKQTDPPATSSVALGFKQKLEKQNHAELGELFMDASTALESRDYETAASLYREVLAQEPGLTAASVGYAVSEISMGHDGIALSVVLDGLALDQQAGSLHELLGDLRNREERVNEALRSWKVAFELSPNDRLRTKIEKAERELAAGGDYRFSSTSHFNVRYDGKVDVYLSSEVMDHLEEEYWRLSRRFRHAPQQPITVLLYPQRQFRDVTRTPVWVGGLYDGKIRVPLGGLNRLTQSARALLSHELAHAVIHSKTRGSAPRWLHEGLAQIVEGRQLLRPDEAEVAALLSAGDPANWTERGFSYAAALSLVRFLEAQRGMDGIVWVLEQLGEGQDLDSALKRIYGLDYSGICTRWAAENTKSKPR